MSSPVDKSADQHQVGRILRNFRTGRAVTQSQVAEALDVPQSYVSKYETGERRLDVLEVRRVCQVLGMSLHEFIDHLESEYPFEG